MIYLPVEFLVIGVAITKKKKQVTSKEVAEYRKRCTFPLEWDSEGKLQFCEYSEDSDTYTVKDNLSIPPYIIQILTSI